MHPSLHRVLIVALPILLVLAGCGGGGGGGGADLQRLTVIAAPEYDGMADTTGLVSFLPGTAFSCAGDLEGTYGPGYLVRQLFAFHVGALPVGARILRAELRLYQVDVEGSPYAKRGDVIVDHVDYIPDPGPDTYDGQNLTRDIGTLSFSPETGLRTLDVTEAIRADVLADRPWSQYRLRFWSAIILPILDHQNDYAQFEHAEGVSGGEVPVLEVVYEP